MTTENPFFSLLYVDNNPQMLLTVAKGLRAYGFKVVTAMHGMDALMQYQAHQGGFGTILTDIDIPKMNGLTFIKQIRGLGYQGRLLVMSGHLTAERTYRNFQISGFLYKPFDITAVITLLLQID